MERRDSKASVTIPNHRFLRDEQKQKDKLGEVRFAGRPQRRGECAEGPRPCPWASCVHHLAVSVKADGALVIERADVATPWWLEDSCSLDLAERHGMTLEEIATAMGLTRERIRQVERKAIWKLREAGVVLSLRGE